MCPSAELEIHVVRRRERLPTEIAEERERHACPGAVLESRMHAYSVYFACSDSVFFCSCMEKSSLRKCHVHIRQRGTSFSSGTLATVGSLPLAKNAKHSPSIYT